MIVYLYEAQGMYKYYVPMYIVLCKDGGITPYVYRYWITYEVRGTSIVHVPMYICVYILCTYVLVPRITQLPITTSMYLVPVSTYIIE